MSYARLLVHLRLGRSNTAVLNIAADLALKSQASVIGIAVYQPLITMTYGNEYLSGDAIDIYQATIAREAGEAEAELRARLNDRAISVVWHCAETVGPLADYLAKEARGADIILAAAGNDGGLIPDRRRMKIGDLVMRSGRPVIVIPDHAKSLNIEHVLIAWKDTREARRATLDALPLLEMAKHVTVASIVEEDEIPATHHALADIVAWLKEHGIAAKTLVQASAGSDVSSLATLAGVQHADVVVAGAYGHSRLREWTFGGVTTDLLLNPDQCVLLSH